MIVAKYYELFRQEENDVNIPPHVPILQEVTEDDDGELNDVYYVRGDGKEPEVDKLGICATFQLFSNALAYARVIYLMLKAKEEVK
jgi:hypothetical protein